MALDQLSIDIDPAPAVLGKINANFAKLALSGAGAPAVPADYVGQEYTDTAGGVIHVAKAVGSAAPADDWEPKVRAGDGRLSDARAPLAHGHGIADVANLQATLNGKQGTSQKGQPNGYAGLDASGKVPGAQLPVASGGAMNHASASGSPGTLVATTEAQIGAVSITPSHAAAQILVLARAELSKDGGTTARAATLRVRRGTQNADPQVGLGSVARSDAAGGAQYGPLVVLAVDQPGTTSTVTYSLRGVVSAGNSTANRFEIAAVELTGAAGPQGPAGPAGPIGATGPAGASGNMVRSGGGVPAAGLGVNGDFYVDTAAHAIYGPKAGGAWGAPTPLVGPRGPAGAGGAYVSQRIAGASGVVTSGDKLGLVRVTGDDVVLVLAKAGIANLEWVEIRNENADDGTAARVVTVSAGADAIDAAGRGSVLLAPGDTLRLVKAADTAPVWLTLSPIGFLALGANQYAASNGAGTAQEARTDRTAVTADIVNPPGDGALGGFRAAWPGKLEAVHAKTRPGAANLVVRRNGAPVTGFAAAKALSTTEASVVCGDSFAAGDYITYHLSRIIAPLDPEDAAVLAGLRAALLARHQPLDEAEAHWVEELATVAWRQRRLRTLEDAVLVRATTGDAADSALPSLATVIRYRGRLDRDWRRATEELAVLRRGRGDCLPDPRRLRRLARQIELAQALATRLPASEPTTATCTNEPENKNGMSETPPSTNEPTAENYINENQISTSEPTSPDRMDDFGRGTNEPRQPVPPLPAGWPTPEPATPARPLNRHQRRRLAALARLGLRSAA